SLLDLRIETTAGWVSLLAPATSPQPPVSRKLGRHRNFHRIVLVIHRDDGDRPAPYARDVLEHLATAIGIQSAPIRDVIMNELELAVDVNARGAHGRRAEAVLGREQRIVQRRQVALLNGQRAVCRTLEAEELQLRRDLLSEVIANEAEVIVLAHDLARVLEPVLFHDLLPNRKAEMVGIRGQGDVLAARSRAHDI